jgi:hypothetical protein
MKKLAIIMALTIVSMHALSQAQSFGYKDYSFQNQVNIGGGLKNTTPSAWLQIGPAAGGSTKGLLLPRGDRNQVTSPVMGLIFYDTVARKVYQFNGSIWVAIGSGGTASGNFIANQNDTAQSGTFWIDGSASVDGLLTAGKDENVNVVSLKVKGAGELVQFGTLHINTNAITTTNTSLQVMNYGVGGLYLESESATNINTGPLHAPVNIGGNLVTANMATAPTGTNGGIYYNTTSNTFQGYQNGAWMDFATGGNGAFIQNQTSTSQPGNFWISGNGKTGSFESVGATYLATSGSDIVRIGNTTTGQLGIGMNPQNALDVNGPVSIGNTLSFNNNPDDFAIIADDVEGHTTAYTPRGFKLVVGGASSIIMETEDYTKQWIYGDGGGVYVGNYANSSYGLHVSSTTGDANFTASLSMGNRLILANLSTAPTGSNGSMYYNTTGNTFQGYVNGAWKNFLLGTGTTSQYFKGDGSLATFPTIPTSSNYISNQQSFAQIDPNTGQAVNFWIKGNGRMDGSLSVSNNAITVGVINNYAMWSATSTSNGHQWFWAGGPIMTLSGAGVLSLINNLVTANKATAPTGTNGAIYYNTGTNKFQGYVNGAWTDFATGSGGITAETDPFSVHTTGDQTGIAGNKQWTGVHDFNGVFRWQGSAGSMMGQLNYATLTGANAGAVALYNSANAFTGVITQGATLTASRTWLFPDKDGTVAMLSDIPGASSPVDLQTATNNGNYSTNNVGLKNTTAATSSVQQQSPAFIQTGNYYNTTTNTSDSARFQTIVNPISQLNGNQSEWHLQGSWGTAGWTDKIVVPISGTIQLKAATQIDGYLTANNSTWRIGDISYVNGYIAGTNTNYTLLKNSYSPPGGTQNAGYNYTNFFWYGANLTEASTGVHHLLANQMFMRNTLNNGAGSTDYGATVYIDGSMVGQAPTLGNYAMWIDSGAFRLDGPLNIDGSEGTAGQVLTSAGPGATPTWQTPSTGGTTPNINQVTSAGNATNNQVQFGGVSWTDGTSQRGSLSNVNISGTTVGLINLNYGATNVVQLRPSALTGTRTALFPDQDITVMGEANTATVTNKTLTATGNNVEGILLGVRYLTTGTSYTPTTGTTKINMILVGAGGGGGGVTGAASSIGAGGGGGAGAILQKYVAVSSGTSYTYAIGTAGTAGANTGGAGGTGGVTSITIAGTTYSANGGGGGLGQATGTALALATGGSAGTGSNGDLNGGGQNGDNGVRLSGTVGISGGGGTSYYGTGGAPLSSAAAGNNATGYGAGGGGALSTANAARAGGLGSPGIIIIYEYR